MAFDTDTTNATVAPGSGQVFNVTAERTDGFEGAITVTLDQQSVQAYGQAQPLTPGMQIDADVMLDRRRLIEWIFEPLLSVTGRI